MEEPIISSEQLVDRLSELPEDLIHLIFSFLPMRDVVATTLLSKMWNDLWITVPYLNFCVDVSRDDRDDEAFVNNVLMLWEGARILKFEVCFNPHFSITSAGDLDSWVNFALERDVEDLSIDLSYDIMQSYWYLMDCEKDVYWVPQFLYSCSSLRKLRLVGCNLGDDGYPWWDKLESLVIEGYYLSDTAINYILFGCPSLEVFEVCLYESYEDLNLVSSSSLKEIKMEKQVCSDDTCNYPVLKMWCPNLATMKVSRGVYYMDDKEKDLALRSWFM